MRKIVILLIISEIVFNAFFTNAQDIGEQYAKEKAISFINSINNVSYSTMRLTLDDLKLVSKETCHDTVLFFTFRILPINGFILVSNEIDCDPILAYSFKNTFRLNDQPPAYKEWLVNYKTQIQSLKRNPTIINRHSRLKWDENWYDKESHDNVMAVSPLLTTTWNQGCYYNDSCPTGLGGPCGHALTGCVFTAMAQIMKYHEHPTTGKGYHCYTHPSYGQICANFENTSYNWASMPDYLSASSTAIQKSSIAQLMLHCGVSGEADYGPSATGSDYCRIINSFVLYFGYDGAITYLFRNKVTPTQWTDTLMTELNSGRPVYYQGGNHAFVCDGYQDNVFFHFNWGWGGSYDGYYNISDLTPGSNNFNSGNRIIYHISPSQNTDISFTKHDDPFPILVSSNCDWGDYDNDGDLDIIYCGTNSSVTTQTCLFKNNNSVFTQIPINVANVNDGSVCWGDYDNDGDLDLAITGYSVFWGSPISKIYRNDGLDVFVDINANMLGVGNSDIRWIDIENDGDLDIVISGYQSTWMNQATKIYTNEGNDSFIESGIIMNNVGFSAIDIGDYDNDNDNDIVIVGFDNTDNGLSTLYINQGDGEFVSNTSILPGIGRGDVKFVDYDSDGDLDIFEIGYQEFENPQYHFHDSISRLYRNDGNQVFIMVSTSIPPTGYGSIDYGDIDNDGDVDLLVTGATEGVEGSPPQTWKCMLLFCENENNNDFEIIKLLGEGLFVGDARLGDYDNDGDLDIFITGSHAMTCGPDFSNILINEGTSFNTNPNSPTSLSYIQNNNSVTFNWEKSTDNETPQNAISYNISIGLDSSSCEILSPMSHLTSGYRKIVSNGNTGLNNSWQIENLDLGIYYWQVQAVDGAYCGSLFSSYDVLSICPTSTFNIYDTACINEVVTVTYTGTGSANANYIWDFDGAIVNSGNGQGPYNVYWTSEGNKYVSLIVIESGASSDTTVNEIFITDIPLTPSTPIGPTEVCQDAPNSLFTTNQVPAATGYNWQLIPWEAGGIIPSDTTCIVDWTPDFYGDCSISVQSWNSCGTSPFSGELEISVLQQPVFSITAAPNDSVLIDDSIYLSTDIIDCSYLWSTGDTTQTIYITNQSGPGGGQELYWLEVTNEEGCNNTEYINVWFLLPINTIFYDNLDGLRIIPNPNAGEFKIFCQELPEIVSIKLFRINGAEIKDYSIKTVDSESIEMSLGKLTSGIYILKVTLRDGHNFINKIIIQ